MPRSHTQRLETLGLLVYYHFFLAAGYHGQAKNKSSLYKAFCTEKRETPTSFFGAHTFLFLIVFFSLMTICDYEIVLFK